MMLRKNIAIRPMADCPDGAGLEMNRGSVNAT